MLLFCWELIAFFSCCECKVVFDQPLCQNVVVDVVATAVLAMRAVVWEWQQIVVVVV